MWDLFTKNLQIKKNIKNNFIKKKNLLKNRNLTNLKIGQRIGLSGNELKKIRQGKIKIEKKRMRAESIPTTQLTVRTS